MNYIKILLLMTFITIFSSLVTNIVRRYSIRKRIFDFPNHRSSHDVPTPKGGGFSIVIILLVSILVLFLYEKISLDLSLSLLIGLSIVSAVGFVDDYRNLSILKRAIAYFIGATVSIYLIGGLSGFNVSRFNVELNEFGFPLAVIFVVWMTNLYNFMDGTDGFAAVQTISVSLFIAVLFYLSGNVSYSIILFSLLASTIGFLYWNWPPAKIFMGDVGSCTIGFLFGLLSIYTEKKGIVSISVWFILLAPFFGDATFTLLKRMINGEKWYKAHNSHAYQTLYKLGASHRSLAIGLFLINSFIIWPLAYIAHIFKNFEIIMILLSYGLLGIIWATIQVKYNNFNKVIS